MQNIGGKHIGGHSKPNGTCSALRKHRNYPALQRARLRSIGLVQFLSLIKCRDMPVSTGATQDLSERGAHARMYKANTKLLGFHFYFQSQSFLFITKATKQTWTRGQNLTFARHVSLISDALIPPPTPTDAGQTALRGPVIRSTPYVRGILFHRKKN